MIDAAPTPDGTPKPAVAKAALYLRVSTGRQAESDLSIPDQRRQITAYCVAKGWDVAAEFVEPGNTATDDRRPAFQAMIDAALVKPPTFRYLRHIVLHRRRAAGETFANADVQDLDAVAWIWIRLLIALDPRQSLQQFLYELDRLRARALCPAITSMTGPVPLMS